MIRWFVNMLVASLIFLPTRQFPQMPQDLDLAYEDVLLVTEDQVTLHGWWFPTEHPTAVLLFFHGNAGNISRRLPKAKSWADRGIPVFLFDYRGYGKSKGRIQSEADLYRDGKAALAWLQNEKHFRPDNIILYGESLGAVVAVQFGTEQSFQAVILEAPFTSIPEIGRLHYPLLSKMIPESWLSDFEMDNEKKISGLKAPVFIIHGTADEVTPFSMGKRLFDAALFPKEFLEIPGGGHNQMDLIAGTAFYDRPFRFAMNAGRTEIQVDSRQSHA